MSVFATSLFTTSPGTSSASLFLAAASWLTSTLAACQADR